MTTNHDLQRTAALVLADLLKHTDLPEVSWSLRKPGKFTDLFAPPQLVVELVAGQADSHQAVRDWAAYLGTSVDLLDWGTLETRAIVDEITVCIWSAPKHRDDLPTETDSEGAG